MCSLLLSLGCFVCSLTPIVSTNYHNHNRNVFSLLTFSKWMNKPNSKISTDTIKRAHTCCSSSTFILITNKLDLSHSSWLLYMDNCFTLSSPSSPLSPAFTRLSLNRETRINDWLYYCFIYLIVNLYNSLDQHQHQQHRPPDRYSVWSNVLLLCYLCYLCDTLQLDAEGTCIGERERVAYRREKETSCAHPRWAN